MNERDVKAVFATLKDAFPDYVGEATPKQEQDAAAMRQSAVCWVSAIWSRRALGAASAQEDSLPRASPQ
jgi:hypothetical protein